jgi:hypothetical protein
MLTAELHLGREGTTDRTLSFVVRNAGPDREKLTFYTPYVGFSLEVRRGTVPIRIVQPAYETPVRPERHMLAPGDELPILTPIELRFDPGSPPSGREPTVWSLDAEPGPAQVTATLRFGSGQTIVCEADLSP